MLAFTLVDLFLFGRGYNPAIPLGQYFPASPVTDFFLKAMKQAPAEPFRLLSLEEEFPPNVLGRYGIADIRNYDSIEVHNNLAFFEPLWAQEGSRLTSNSWTTGPRIAANLDLLRLANVRYLISTSDHVPGRLVHRHGRVGVYQIEPWGRILQSPAQEPLGEGQSNEISQRIVEYRPGHIEAAVDVPSDRRLLVFSQTFMPGWEASIDGVPSDVRAYRGTFLSVLITPGKHRIVFNYSPDSFRLGVYLSATGIVATLSLLGSGLFRRQSAC